MNGKEQGRLWAPCIASSFLTFYCMAKRLMRSMHINWLPGVLLDRIIFRRGSVFSGFHLISITPLNCWKKEDLSDLHLYNTRHKSPAMTGESRQETRFQNLPKTFYLGSERMKRSVEP